MLLKIVCVAGVALLAAATYQTWSYRAGLDAAERALASIAAAPPQSSGAVFNPAMVADLPEIAQRYFRHAIAPGTPLKATVMLQMRGQFLLGDRSNSQAYQMEARQILAPPNAFVWLPLMQSGLLRISGSDGLRGGAAWTQFWINSLIPVVNRQSDPDLIRSAQFRSAIESIWAPAALLPREGIAWQAKDANTATVTFSTFDHPVVIELTLNGAGAVTEVTGLRWSDANPEGTFRLQPFGGRVESEATFAGYTIPSKVKVGNLFGTEDFLPFFQAEIVDATYR